MGQMVPKMTLGTRIPAGMDGEGARPKIYWAGQGGAGNPPFPTVQGGAGKGSKSAGLGGARVRKSKNFTDRKIFVAKNFPDKTHKARHFFKMRMKSVFANLKQWSKSGMHGAAFFCFGAGQRKKNSGWGRE